MGNEETLVALRSDAKKRSKKVCGRKLLTQNCE